MKKTIMTIVAMAASCLAFAQQNPATKAGLAVYFPEVVESIPASAMQNLTNRISAATAKNGMAAADFTQFYITCVPTENDKYVVAGSPAKFFNKTDLNFYVVDAFANRVFNSYVLPTQGVGNSEEKAYIECFKRFSPSSDAFAKFLNKTNELIIAYYEAQCDNIIKKAQTLAKGYNYEEALFELSLVPDCCPCYPRILEAADEIYAKYIDDLAAKNLAAARSIWAAGQDATAAAEAGEYLAQILPDSKYYKEAVALSDEMKARVKSDIDYYRALEARDNAQNYELAKEQTKAWRDVGVAYGNHQQATTYNNAWLWR